MNEIVYFSRNKKNRFSIENVTNNIISEISKANFVRNYEVPNATASLMSIIGNIAFVFKNKSKNGINHITGDIHYAILGLIGCKSVLTIHDLVFLEGKQNKLSYWFKYLLWLYIPVKMADKIICISEKTKQDILKHIKTNKITVIYNPIVLAKKIKQEVKSFNEECPVVLFVGTKSNKNLERTLLALKGINCKVLIIGRLSDEQKMFLESNQIIYENRCNLSDKSIADAYYESDIVSFMSIYEGFGMPIVEGQLAGCVVITSNFAPMTEVGASSVVYADPYDIYSMHIAFKNIIFNKKYREQKIKEGFNNTIRFSPEKIAMEYMNLYNNL